MLRFSNWSPDVGPSYRIDDSWTQCENYAENGEVPTAAKILREALEEEFQTFCANLKGKVPFKSDASWTLGELLDGALSAFKSILKKAKDVASSSGKQENLKKIEEIENTLNIVKEEADIDKWILNPMNHYNEWSKFSKEELKNLIQSMRKFCKAFSFEEDLFIISFDNQLQPIALTTQSTKIFFSLKK